MSSRTRLQRLAGHLQRERVGMVYSIFTLSLAVAQTTPDVQFTDITAQSHVDFTQENSATSNKY